MKDTDQMPFGKYKGRQMQYVPADYLIWIFEEGKCTDNVKKYIEDNMNVLEHEINSNKKQFKK
ncbi:hypothetical protein CMU91_14880 [Elizabethkingia anophelis]|nr:hypothetical protein [Elizabethkingia anophelis]